jgi:hypothetical protein
MARCATRKTSLGALVAMRIAGREDPGPVKAVLAVDPPITTSRLWNAERALRGHLAQHPQNALAREFVAEVFGFVETGNEERIYYPLVRDLRRPARIAMGSLPLMPVRELDVIACLFDEVDRFVIEQYHADKAEVRRLPGKHHLLLFNDRENCQVLIEEMVDTYL